MSNNRVQLELGQKIKECEAEIGREQSEMDDVERVKEEIETCEREKTLLRAKQTQVDEQINKWHVNSKSKTELEMMQNDRKAKLEQIRRSKKLIEEELENFFDMSDNSQVSLKPKNFQF